MQFCYLHHLDVKGLKTVYLYSVTVYLYDHPCTRTVNAHAEVNVLGPISQRDLSPDLDLNLRLWS